MPLRGGHRWSPATSTATSSSPIFVYTPVLARTARTSTATTTKSPNPNPTPTTIRRPTVRPDSRPFPPFPPLPPPPPPSAPYSTTKPPPSPAQPRPPPPPTLPPPPRGPGATSRSCMPHDCSGPEAVAPPEASPWASSGPVGIRRRPSNRRRGSVVAPAVPWMPSPPSSPRMIPA